MAAVITSKSKKLETHRKRLDAMTLTANSHEFDQFSVGITFQKSVGSSEGSYQDLVDFVMRYAFYAALTAIFLMVIALIIKLMWDCDGYEGTGERARATESSRLFLVPKDEKVISYGTRETNDLESGSSSSSDDDLYDGKICVICYDGERTCFFIPCGHCVCCHTCAHRIVGQDTKSCPICRGIIEKVRKMHIV